MTHIHWVTRQNKVEIPRDKDEVNKREIHECDGRAHDPDTISKVLFIYYESRNREIKTRLIYEDRCDERLKARVQEATCLTYTGLHDKTN